MLPQTRRTKETASSRASGWWTLARLDLGASRGRRGTTSATPSTGVTTMAAVKVDEAVEVVAAEVSIILFWLCFLLLSGHA